MKIYDYKSGAWTVFEKLQPSGMYLVKLYGADGELRDKMLCDDYRNARAYLKCFNKLAKIGGGPRKG